MEKVPCEPMVGTDLEAFVYSVPNKCYVPCVGLLPGTKDRPEPLKGLGEGFAVQEDNVMAEFNIPPATSSMVFAYSIFQAAEGVRKLLPPDHILKFESSAQFKPMDLTSPQAKLIGCDPDFDAYNGGTVRHAPPPLGLHRGAGGHIHLGGDFRCPDFVAALFAEAMIGVRCGLRPSPADHRARWYGLPGIYRPKPYGVEYRTPSCTWAAQPDMAEYVGGQALACATWLTNTEPTDLQSIFRRVSWTKIRGYMTAEVRDAKESDSERSRLIKHLKTVGVPI